MKMITIIIVWLKLTTVQRSGDETNHYSKVNGTLSKIIIKLQKHKINVNLMINSHAYSRSLSRMHMAGIQYTQ